MREDKTTEEMEVEIEETTEETKTEITDLDQSKCVSI